MYLSSLEKTHEAEGCQKRVAHELKRFQQKYVPGARGFLLWGEPGRGKTYLVCAVLRYLTLERGQRAKFVDFFQLLNDLKAAYDSDRSEESLMAPLVNVDVLVIDELGKGRATEWELSVLDQLVSRRYNAGRTLLATTNFNPLDGDNGGSGVARLVDRVGDRIYSRLFEMCEFIEVQGKDWRRDRSQMHPTPTPAPSPLRNERVG